MTDQTSGPAALFMQQIRFISDSMVELKAMVKNLDERMRAVELSEAGCQAINQNQLTAAHRRLDENRRDIDSIDARVIVIERKLPQIDELLGIKNKLIVIVALAGFVGTTVGGLFIKFLFEYFAGGM